MTPIQVLNHFAGPKGTESRVVTAAAKLGISRQAVHKWLRDGRIPHLRQSQIQVATRGKLKADRKERA
jgi:predicted site-specific integrase-resolvase